MVKNGQFFMEVKTEVDVLSVDTYWSGAVDTLLEIKAAGKEEEFVALLTDVFSDRPIDQTELNDFLWFDSDYIFEAIGLTKDGDEED